MIENELMESSETDLLDDDSIDNDLDDELSIDDADFENDLDAELDNDFE